jgi:hypothetical protein
MPELKPPYGIIANAMRNGQVVPFLGAGASLVNRPPNWDWNIDRAEFLPTGAELAAHLADISEFPSQDVADRSDLAKVASYCTVAGPRCSLLEVLHNIFQRRFDPGPLHRWLAAIDKPMLIVVTNYDLLLEQAFKTAKRPYDLVVQPADQTSYGNAVLWWPNGQQEPEHIQPNSLIIDPAEKTVIYKMHGSVSEQGNNWDNFVITEEDYVDFLSRMSTKSSVVPKVFLDHFRRRSFLFLGYSLRDWNLRVILHKLGGFAWRPRAAGQDEGLQSWAIQRDPTALERALWSKRMVNIYNKDIDSFVEKMRTQMGM